MFSVKNFQTKRFFKTMVLSLVAIALLSLPATAQFKRTDLDSDIPGITPNPTDGDLVNPWGIAASPKSPWWVSDNGTGKSTLYDGNGVKQGLIVNIPQWDQTPGGNPTGTVFNPTSDFQITSGNPAFFLFGTEDGTIQGWNPTVNATQTEIMVNGWPDAVYKGLTLGSANGKNYIYAANFRAGKVDVFDANFKPHSFGTNAFVDSTIPSTFSPFNVANINGMIVVTYAVPNKARHDDVQGAFHGYVRVFDSQGNVLMRPPHVFQLDSPWAITLAPAKGFGQFSGNLLIGNFGSGAIVGFDLAHNGAFLGALVDNSGLPLRINGLWGLGVGNGSGSGSANSLYFAAGYFDEVHGLFGTITPLLAGGPPSFKVNRTDGK
jgi:uncharacterized protein (TIGR03118 family)